MLILGSPDNEKNTTIYYNNRIKHSVNYCNFFIDLIHLKHRQLSWSLVFLGGLVISVG